LEMKEHFQNIWVVIAYVLGVVSLFWHLVHGFPSAFQTFGINHKRYTPAIKIAGWVFAIIVCLLFAAMPLTMYFGKIA
jgi:succinate dehydrogenase / fumarate reductase, cytochrome b subunit